ncbi:hypothetical protein F2P81_024590 [Scophthalmus maximus]|uniref:Uncharacterized protein n=1 Tax=Scophthalmus maximus TaxID=52904 RepID=A0A6A4RXB0_SCOMX|nr:hypothetical protein F2P81_024590 [Scophthalmus maximus]
MTSSAYNEICCSRDSPPRTVPVDRDTTDGDCERTNTALEKEMSSHVMILNVTLTREPSDEMSEGTSAANAAAKPAPGSDAASSRESVEPEDRGGAGAGPGRAGPPSVGQTRRWTSPRLVSLRLARCQEVMPPRAASRLHRIHVKSRVLVVFLHSFDLKFILTCLNIALFRESRSR